MKKIFIILLLLTNAQFSQWLKQTTPVDVNVLLCIDFYNQNSGVAGGWKFSNDYIGRAIYTTNSGINWILSILPDSARTIVKIQMLNQSTGFIVGSYNTNIIESPSQQRNNSQFFNNCPVFIQNYFSRIGMDYHIYNFKGMFLKTTNGGQLWFNGGNLPSNIRNVVGLKFININTGFITALLDYSTGNRYEILKSTNGGSSWTSSIVMDSVYLYGIFTFDGNNIFVSGTKFSNGTPYGIILKSANSGINWVSQNISNTIGIVDVAFSNTTTGFAVAESWGISVKILKTTDLGLSWSVSSTLPINTMLNGIEFVYGQGKGIATGTENITAFGRPLIYRTTNYGTNWSSYLIPDTNSLYDQSLIDQNIWFVCGGTGDAIVYKSFNGGEIGIKHLGNQIPITFSLSQNYPNPFNPVTKIKFAVPTPPHPSPKGRESSFVNLIIYDALGCEVQTLVNEQLQPGTYEVEFNGSNFSSGVYYYTLSTDDYFETKRMVLIK